MKKLLCLLSICIVALNACKKDSLPPQTIGINGTFYKTGIFGSKTWTTENYRGPGGIDLANNNSDYGKLYTIAEAKAIALPKDWRVATIQDYYELLALTGAGDRNKGYTGVATSQVIMLMSASGWDTQNGNNFLGFNAFPAGYYVKTSTGFVWQDAKKLAVFVTTATQGNVNRVFTLGVDAAGGPIAVNADLLKTIDDRGSVRFVKNNPGV